MKKSLKISLISLSCASLLALSACAATPSVSIAPNWYNNTVLTSSISQTYEKLTYAVKYEKGTNENYSVEYDDGVYTVELKNTTFNDESVYVLTSELQISGKYTMGSQTLEFTDSVQSTCYFRNAKEQLYPLKSVKTVKSTTPYAKDAQSLEQAVKTYEYVTEVVYDPDENTAVATYTDLKDESKNSQKEYSLQDNLTVLDNESLLFAVRGVSLAANATECAYVLNPYAAAQETVNITFKTQTKDAKYTFKNVDNGDASAKEYTLDVNTLSINRKATMAGKTVTAVYAAPVANNKTYRCVMLKMENPLSYQMGKLVYTLTEADFTDK